MFVGILVFTAAIMAFAAGMARPAWLTRFSRVPIRARLTIAFVAMMATVLTAAGVFLYGQFRSTLDAQIDDALRLQAADVGALVARGHSSAIAASGNPLAVGCRAGGGLAQVYRADGRLLASPHTVSSHLRHSFAKLDIKSRVELTRIVVAEDRETSELA